MNKFERKFSEPPRMARGEDTTAGAIRQSAKPETETAPNDKPDPVNSPSHYQHGGIETIDIIRAMLTADEFRGYLKGNIIKYRDRAPYKGKTDEDYAKAKRYWDWLKEL